MFDASDILCMYVCKCFAHPVYVCKCLAHQTSVNHLVLEAQKEEWLNMPLCKNEKKAIVNQASLGTVLKTVSGEPLRGGIECIIICFPECVMAILI